MANFQILSVFNNQSQHLNNKQSLDQIIALQQVCRILTRSDDIFENTERSCYQESDVVAELHQFEMRYT